MQILVVIAAGILLVCVVGLLLSLPLMWLWNWLMPIIFGLPTLTWLQSWGLLVLCGFLFKNSTVSKS